MIQIASIQEDCRNPPSPSSVVGSWGSVC